MPEPATLLMGEFVTHDVRRLLIGKPEALAWEPGQGTEVRIAGTIRLEFGARLLLGQGFGA